MRYLLLMIFLALPNIGMAKTFFPVPEYKIYAVNDDTGDRYLWYSGTGPIVSYEKRELINFRVHYPTTKGYKWSRHDEGSGYFLLSRYRYEVIPIPPYDMPDIINADIRVASAVER